MQIQKVSTTNVNVQNIDAQKVSKSSQSFRALNGVRYFANYYPEEKGKEIVESVLNTIKKNESIRKFFKKYDGILEIGYNMILGDSDRASVSIHYNDVNKKQPLYKKLFSFKPYSNKINLVSNLEIHGDYAEKVNPIIEKIDDKFFDEQLNPKDTDKIFADKIDKIIDAINE